MLVRARLVGAIAVLAIGTVNAEIFSDAAKIGANAGAMTYCKDNIAAEEDRGKYNLLAIKTLKEYDDLDSEDRLKALVFRKSAEDGEYLGDPLTEDRCDSIRKLLFLR
jgi:hypothetical protein